MLALLIACLAFGVIPRSEPAYLVTCDKCFWIDDALIPDDHCLFNPVAILEMQFLREAATTTEPTVYDSSLPTDQSTDQFTDQGGAVEIALEPTESDKELMARMAKNRSMKMALLTLSAALLTLSTLVMSLIPGFLVLAEPETPVQKPAEPKVAGKPKKTAVKKTAGKPKKEESEGTLALDGLMNLFAEPKPETAEPKVAGKSKKKLRSKSTGIRKFFKSRQARHSDI